MIDIEYRILDYNHVSLILWEEEMRMQEQNRQLHERLLQECQFRREMVKFYTTTLLRLSPGDRDAQQRWSELTAKLSAARIALIQATDQLQSYELPLLNGNLAQR